MGRVCRGGWRSTDLPHRPATPPSRSRCRRADARWWHRLDGAQARARHRPPARRHHLTADGEIPGGPARQTTRTCSGRCGGVAETSATVTEFEFRAPPDDRPGAARRALLRRRRRRAVARSARWRDLLPDAPREATLDCDAITAGDVVDPADTLHGRPVGVGRLRVGRRHRRGPRLPRTIPAHRDADRRERSETLTYIELQSIADENHRHGPVLREGPLPDRALRTPQSTHTCRAASPPGVRPHWPRIPYGGLQANGGAIADKKPTTTRRSATVRPWSNAEARRTGSTPVRTTSGSQPPARTGPRRLEPFATGMYVNTIADEGPRPASRRAYHPDAKLDRLAEIKRTLRPRQRLPPQPQHQAGAGRRLARRRLCASV